MKAENTTSLIHKPLFVLELIITAGGENIAPVPIEEQLKLEVPILSNAMLIGDKRKFLSCLLSLKVLKEIFLNIPHQ